jgi:hypothetical protein
MKRLIGLEKAAVASGIGRGVGSTTEIYRLRANNEPVLRHGRGNVGVKIGEEQVDRTVQFIKKECFSCRQA